MRTLKNKIHKYMTSVSKIVYVDKLDDTVNKYNKTYHSTIKVKPVAVKLDAYIDSSKEVNNIDPKFKVGNVVRISKYKNDFDKGYTTNWSEEVFVIKKVKLLCCGHMLLMILMEQILLEPFMKKSCKRLIKKSLELKKQSREKMINYMLNGKVMIIRLIVG